MTHQRDRKRYTDAEKRRFFKLVEQGAPVLQAARAVGAAEVTGYRWIKAAQIKPKFNGPSKPGQATHFTRSAGKDPRGQFSDTELPSPVDEALLCEEAQRALEDFHFFSERYLGRVRVPWRREAADRILELYRDDEKRFAVVNAPPGAGKSTLFTHDIPAWLTCHDRSIRGVLGSWGERPAQSFTRNLRRTLERTAPAPVGDDEVAARLAVEPSGVLARDFGRFKPLDGNEFWTATAFVVEQSDGRAVADKEPTWTAFGQGEILGWRVDLMIWDDLVTTRKLSSETEQDRLHRWWDNEVEKRLEPGGLMVLQGQRLGANDLYRYCLDKLDITDDDEVEFVDLDDLQIPRKYHHVKFKAHFEDRCEGAHDADASAYPEGCLLDPRRLKWRDLRREKANDPVFFETVYQQEDTSPDSVLVPPAWIAGDGFPGCWDEERGAWELPALEGKFVTVITCDPSPTKSWGVQAWAIHPASNQFFLLDLFRGKMAAEDLLYFAHSGSNVTSTTDFSGLLEDWRKAFSRIGQPLRHVVVEKNVAQRFLLQYPHTNAWARKFQVRIHDHETDPHNKADKDFGIQMLRPLFEHGNIRLPGLREATGGRMPGYFPSAKLVKELTTYSLQFGASGSDDQVMACWFMAHKARRLVRAERDDGDVRLFANLPSWLGGRRRSA